VFFQEGDEGMEGLELFLLDSDEGLEEGDDLGVGRWNGVDAGAGWMRVCGA
jgi:hypothetical protein